MQSVNVKILFVLLAVSCISPIDESIETPEYEGFKILNKHGELWADFNLIEKWTNNFVIDKYGETINFKITEVKTYYFESHLVSHIYLRFSDGQSDSFLVSDSGLIKRQGSNLSTDCIGYSFSCSGSSCCQVAHDVGSDVVYCACNYQPSGTTCSLMVRCITE